MLEKHKIPLGFPTLSKHSQAGLVLILSTISWWISANFAGQNFNLLLGVLTFGLTLLVGYTAFKSYKSDLQKKFTEASILNLVWMISLTILVENCFFHFQNPHRLILSVFFGGMAITVLLVDIFLQPSLYKLVLQHQQSFSQKSWSLKMIMILFIPTNVLQFIALYTLIRYPFLDQFSWNDYPNQYWFLVNAWHLTVSVSIFNLPILSLFNLNKINEKLVYIYLTSITLLTILFSVSCIYMKVKWFF